MKKFLAIVIIAGALLACNNSSKSTAGADTTAAPLDSGQHMMFGDSMSTGTDTSRASTDTTHK